MKGFDFIYVWIIQKIQTFGFCGTAETEGAIGWTGSAAGALDVVFDHPDARRIGGIGHAGTCHAEGDDDAGVFEPG